MLIETPFTQKHIALGAKMADFAGFNMPISYSSITEEHECVRNKVGVFDVSHMGEFWVSGPDAIPYLQKITSNDVSKLVDGQAQYSCFPNHEGGIVDDLLVYRIDAEHFLMVVNGANIDKDWAWVESNIDGFDCEIKNISAGVGLLAVQGPKAIDALQSLVNFDLNELKYYTFKIDEFAGVDNVIISATGYTGSGGFEIYFYSENAEKIWDAIFEAGKAHGIQPIGLAARDTLRLEMGFCLYGNDIDDTTNPIEAGLGWITKVDKGDFNGKAPIVQMKTDKPTRRLVGFELLDRGIPRQGYIIEDAEGNEIGYVTSGSQGPSVGKAIGMGYVNKPLTKADSEIYIAVRKKKLKAKVVKVPFYKG